MTPPIRSRFVLAACGLTLALAPTVLPARAALETAIGTQATVSGETVATCSSKAKAALNSVLQNAFEAGDNTHQWLAYGPTDSSGKATATASIHCFAVGSGYVVSFACAAQVPPNPQTAAQLCSKLVAAFPTSGGAAPQLRRLRR